MLCAFPNCPILVCPPKVFGRQPLLPHGVKLAVVRRCGEERCYVFVLQPGVAGADSRDLKPEFGMLRGVFDEASHTDSNFWQGQRVESTANNLAGRQSVALSGQALTYASFGPMLHGRNLGGSGSVYALLVGAKDENLGFIQTE